MMSKNFKALWPQVFVTEILKDIQYTTLGCCLDFSFSRNSVDPDKQFKPTIKNPLPAQIHSPQKNCDPPGNALLLFAIE